jgi:hypothetical protein
VLETVDLDTLAVTPVPLSGFNYGPMLALTYDGVELLGAGEVNYVCSRWGCYEEEQDFVRLSETGESEQIGTLDHKSKGLAFVFVDSDQDGLTDSKELLLGTNPYNPDTDGDGFADGEEAFLGSNPSDPNDFPITVGLEIKPGSDPNSINPSLEGDLPVAILGTDVFDVADVDVTTLAFGPSRASFDHSHGPHLEDVNGDGFTDLMAHFRIEDAGIAFGDPEACATGKKLDGKPFMGCDAIRTVPDMDGDALLDVEEATIGTDALNPDTDGDGFDDGEEVLLMGTDPLDSLDPAPAKVRGPRKHRKRSR